MTCNTCLYSVQYRNFYPCNVCDHINNKYLAKNDFYGQIIALSFNKDEEYEGLKGKYRVFKSSNGEPVEDCFILLPDKDTATRKALETYAQNTTNTQFKIEIIEWLKNIQ